MRITNIALFFSLSFISISLSANGNITNDSFNAAKKKLERNIYYDNRETIYCGAKFDAKKNIEAPQGFVTTTHLKRSNKVEREQ